MTKNELIVKLQSIPGNPKVMVEGQESGCDNLKIDQSMVIKNPNPEDWWEGQYILNDNGEHVLVFTRDSNNDKE